MRRWLQPAAVLFMVVLSAEPVAAQTPEQLLEQARTALGAGKNADAVALLDRYLGLRPDDVEGWVNRVRAKVALNDADGGLRDANRAIFLDPANASAYFFRARTRQLKSDQEGAIADYSTALLLNPKMPGAYNNRANCRKALNDNEGAIADYRKSLELDPTSELVQKNLTALQLRMGVAAPPALPPANDLGLPPPPALPPPPLPPAGGGVEEAAPLRVGGAVPAPRVVKQVDPEYPDVARRAGVQGPVVLDVVIGPDGRVREATVVKSVPALDAAAVTAVRRWEFEPPLVNGRPEVVILTVTVTFK